MDLKIQTTGFSHELRLLLNALMANSECGETDAVELAKVLGHINDLHGQKSHDLERVYE